MNFAAGNGLIVLVVTKMASALSFLSISCTVTVFYVSFQIFHTFSNVVGYLRFVCLAEFSCGIFEVFLLDQS